MSWGFDNVGELCKARCDFRGQAGSWNRASKTTHRRNKVVAARGKGLIPLLSAGLEREWDEGSRQTSDSISPMARSNSSIAASIGAGVVISTPAVRSRSIEYSDDPDRNSRR